MVYGYKKTVNAPIDWGVYYICKIPPWKGSDPWVPPLWYAVPGHIKRGCLEPPFIVVSILVSAVGDEAYANALVLEWFAISVNVVLPTALHAGFFG
jgi:hypothetical protein